MPDIPDFVRLNINNLPALCWKLKLNSSRIATQTGINPSSITAFLRGKSFPRQDTYNKLAAFFNWKRWDNPPIPGANPDRLAVNHCYTIASRLYGRPRSDFHLGTGYVYTNSVLRFVGFLHGKFSFREIRGGWTISLSRNQLMDKMLTEVSA